jgi:hypothetical protein
MSNFSSLKNVPPVFQKGTAGRVWNQLKQPFSIAVLASLGVHGLLWFGLPLVPASSSKPPETQRTLGVVELSPLEQQARLPQSSLLQPLPKSTAPKSTPSDVPLVPIDPNVLGSDPYYQIPETSSSSNFDPGAIISKRKPAKSTAQTRRNETQTKDTKESESEAEETNKTSANSEDLVGPDGKPLSKSREEQEKIALQQSFAFNATGTSEQDFTSNAAIVAGQIADKYSIPNWEKSLKLRAPYPKEACQFQHEGKAVQGETVLVAVLQSNGTLSDTAILVKSSGFKGLDEAARKFVETQWSDIAKQNKVETGSKPKAFPLAITVEPTEADCAGAKPIS